MNIAIHEISKRGKDAIRWLCRDHATARTADGWTVKVGAPLPDGMPCVTPTVDFVPPDPDSRLPTRAEVARMSGVAPMKRPMTEQRKAKAA